VPLDTPTAQVKRGGRLMLRLFGFSTCSRTSEFASAVAATLLGVLGILVRLTGFTI